MVTNAPWCYVICTFHVFVSLYHLLASLYKWKHLNGKYGKGKSQRLTSDGMIRFSPNPFTTRRQKDVGGQHHAPAALPHEITRYLNGKRVS